jgi:hypothetical protein
MSCVRSEARVIVSVPGVVHPPDAIAELVLVKVRVPADVELPVSPVKVTTGLPLEASVDDAIQVESSGTLELSCTVMVLMLQGQGVLWLAVATVHASGLIMRAPAPVIPLKLPIVM